MTELSLFLPDEAATVATGETLASAIQPIMVGDKPANLVVYLKGSLGAGKTTLSRGILRGLGHRSAVKSPTYTLVEPYVLAGGCLYHFDLYRLKDPQELDYLGIEDYFQPGCICLVEWPERGQGWIPAEDISITLGQEAQNHERQGRRLVLRASSPVGESLLKAFSLLTK